VRAKEGGRRIVDPARRTAEGRMIIVKRDGMSQFGSGRVDFTLSAGPRSREREQVVAGRVRDVGRKHSFAERTAFAKLKLLGFNGPIMVEGVKAGATAEETAANARANREFFGKRARFHLRPRSPITPPRKCGRSAPARTKFAPSGPMPDS